MRRSRSTTPPQQPTSTVATVTALGVAVAALYFAQEVLIPLALAIMFSFLLAPFATWLERHGLGRVPSVVLVVFIGAALLVSLGYVVGKQVYSLAESRPSTRRRSSARRACCAAMVPAVASAMRFRN
jgi:predicted PurR-regulated permease PerM